MNNYVKKLVILLSASLLLVSMASSVFAKAADNAMTITDGSKVSLEYTLTLKDEGAIDNNIGGEPMVFVYGSKQVIPGLEKGVTGLKTGDVKKLEIAPEDAYGPIYQEAFSTANKSQFPADLLQIDAIFETQGPDGQTYRGKVISIEGEEVKVDFNHPLAGKTLFFDIKVLSVEQQ